MFGLNDNSQQSNDDPAMLDNVKQLVNETDSGGVQLPNSPDPVSQNVQTLPPIPTTASPAHAEPAVGFASSPVKPPEPPEPKPDMNINQTTTGVVANKSITSSDTNNDSDDSSSPSVDKNHLADMKQQALDHLEPLVEHLDQSAEDAFKTTMMMIQANDNHSLLDKALDSAKKITDDKVRAQAMLDIINEINYFSQNS